MDIISSSNYIIFFIIFTQKYEKKKVRLKGRKVMKPKVVCNNRMKNPIPPPALKHSQRNQTLMCAPRCVHSIFPKCPSLYSPLFHGEIQADSCLRHNFIELEKPSVLNTPCCCRGRLLTDTEWCCEETKILPKDFQFNTSTSVFSFRKIYLSTAEASGPISSSFSVNEHVCTNPCFDWPMSFHWYWYNSKKSTSP